MKWLLKWLLVLALCAVPLPLAAEEAPAAAPSPSPSPDEGGEQELVDLLAILEEETEIATRTRLNSDFVPGLVTVLQAEEMEALGFETVWDALALVPGVHSQRDAEGAPNLVVRGIDFPFNSGNVKVLVDGVPLSRDSAGLNNVVMLTPLGVVERIEVIRGPGSVIYGDFAFMGLVNIVTRRHGTHAYLRAGGDEAWSGGATWAGEVGRFQVAAAAAGWTSDDAAFPVPSHGDEDRGWGSLQVSRGGLSLAAKGIHRGIDRPAATGVPASDGQQTHGAVELRWGRDWSPAWRSELRGVLVDNDVSGFDRQFQGTLAEAGLDVHWRRGRHTALVGVSGVLGRIDEATAVLGAPPPPPGQPPAPPVTLTIRDEERNVASVVAQDRFDVSSQVSLTVGARFDHYSDVGDQLTPRASLAWRVSDRHIVKLQHAEGFRAPNFFELYISGQRQPDLEPEINATSELNYVFRASKRVLRATLFRTHIRNMIFGAGPRRFGNDTSARAHGFELEAEQQLTSTLKALGNLSFTDEEENRSLDRSTLVTPPAARWLGNLALLWRALPQTMFALRLTHVGERTGGVAPAYDVLDLSLTRKLHRFELAAGVKNATDDEPVYVFGRPGGSNLIRFPGRTFWAELRFSR